MISPYDRHNTSVSQTPKSAGTREGRYRPTRSKTFIDRLQKAKREKEEFKIKLCKHIIWTILNIYRLPENSYLLHELFLTDNEALSVVGNSSSVIPQNLMYKTGNNKTRKEVIQELLSNDPRSKNQQVWTLALKKKKKRTSPKMPGL